MLCLNYLLLWAGLGMILIASAMLGYDLYLNQQCKNALAGTAHPARSAVRWRAGLALALLAWAPMVVALGAVMIASSMPHIR